MMTFVYSISLSNSKEYNTLHQTCHFINPPLQALHTSY